MRKIAVTLAVLLLATPALAAVKIIIEDEGGYTAAIKYETDGGEVVRAFALDIKVVGATIDGCSDYVKGESAPGNVGYGIFPANFSRHITVDAATGEVTTWDVNEYTPVADAADPGALGGLGTDGVTIEMGGLWYPPEADSPNAPGNSGLLCKLTVSDACTMSAEENPTRGGIVLTDPSVTPTVDRTGATDVSITGEVECFPDTNPAYSDWVALGSPECWCAPQPDGTGGSGYQCDGDADGKATGFPTYHRISTGDLQVLVENWQKKDDDPTLNPCADIDHKRTGFPTYFRVSTGDLTILVNNWQKKDTALPGDCPR
jgi:hypothetical protein